MGMLIFGSPWHLPPAWGDIPTWITAIATVGLLAGAIVTAIYAINAFRKQSEQLDEQRRINKLQAEDLRGVAEGTGRLRQIAEREQADEVGFAWWPPVVLIITSGPAATRHTGHARGRSSRRHIGDVSARWSTTRPAAGSWTRRAA